MATIQTKNEISNKPKFFFFLTTVGVIILILLYQSHRDPKSATGANSTEQSTIQRSTSEIKEELGWSCSICGRKFQGRGYKEKSNGVWIPCEDPYQCQICSPECGRKHTQTWQKIDETINNNRSARVRCKNRNLGYYENGFCDRCSAASSERVNESREKLPDCFLCKGTGIEKPMGSRLNDESGRICPACNGTGKTSY